MLPGFLLLGVPLLPFRLLRRLIGWSGPDKSAGVSRRYRNYSVTETAAEIRTRREAEEAEAAKPRNEPGAPFVRGFHYLGTIALARGDLVSRE